MSDLLKAAKQADKEEIRIQAKREHRMAEFLVLRRRRNDTRDVIKLDDGR